MKPEIEKERLRNAVADLANLHDTDNWDLGDRILRDVIEKLDFEELKNIIRKNSVEIAVTIQKLSNGNISYMEVIEETGNENKAQRAEILSNLALALWVAEGVKDAPADEKDEAGGKGGMVSKRSGISIKHEKRDENPETPAE